MVKGVLGGIAIAENTHTCIYVLRERFTKYLSLESLPLKRYFSIFLLKKLNLENCFKEIFKAIIKRADLLT